MKINLKKIVSLLAALSMLLILCSCNFSFKKMPKLPSMNFTSDAQINYKTYDVMSCKITSEQDGPLNVEVTKPALLAGLTVVCQDDSCTIKYGSLSYDADTQKYPQLAFGNILKQAVESAKENPDYSQTDDGNWSIHTTVNGSDVWMVLDGETYYPLSLKVPSEELEITFTNFTETDKTK